MIKFQAIIDKSISAQMRENILKTLNRMKKDYVQLNRNPFKFDQLCYYKNEEIYRCYDNLKFVGFLKNEIRVLVIREKDEIAANFEYWVMSEYKEKPVILLIHWNLAWNNPLKIFSKGVNYPDEKIIMRRFVEKDF